jgi:hypothetical protein
MELFTKLFSDLLVFVYHCFDRIVIHGYLSGLSRPEQVVHFFRQVVGTPVVSKELLSQRTSDYQNWVEAFARNHKVPIQWAEKGVRKEDYVQPWLRRMSMASTSSSRAWSRGRPSVSPCRSIPLRIPTTASWLARGAASRTTTSTSAMKFSVQSGGRGIPVGPAGGGLVFSDISSSKRARRFKAQWAKLYPADSLYSPAR